VSVAVLLDNFITETSREKHEQMALEIEEMRAKDHMVNPLDPLLRIIANEYVDDADLERFLRRLFFLIADLAGETETFDAGTGQESTCKHEEIMLAPEQVCSGLRSLDVQPRIHITLSDLRVFRGLVDPGPQTRRDPDGSLGISDFVQMMRLQVQGQGLGGWGKRGRESFRDELDELVSVSAYDTSVVMGLV
jgi:hypothetical protein